MIQNSFIQFKNTCEYSVNSFVNMAQEAGIMSPSNFGDENRGLGSQI